ncbi:hypothetical protein [Streptomyces himalayensis]|uniref:Uncharacterized protein n=1 Tax=Streptomyces himalayensis subsp. himalayensis TaxID=2756131 RepID=A0A7W0I9V3_9ACTN|nr:hypothetical protein [Streptomyces himalayensis]MBA2947449.1 hypothetical protein [Streptomyces himalayensis subsp. himalayensis]
MNASAGNPIPTPNAQLTGAYWLDSPVGHAEDCPWCEQLREAEKRRTDDTTVRSNLSAPVSPAVPAVPAANGRTTIAYPPRPGELNCLTVRAAMLATALATIIAAAASVVLG